MKKIFHSLTCMVLLISCNDKKEGIIINDSKEIKVDTIAVSSETIVPADTIRIDYEENKELLQILKLLPDKAMESWKWSKKEREDMVNFIEKYDYVLDTTPNYQNIKYAQGNTFGMQIVDGFWTMSIYKIKKGNYLVITDDIVGDGESMVCFEFDKGTLQEIKTEFFFGNLLKNVLKDENNTICTTLLEDNEVSFDYNFKDKQHVKISSWALNEKENADCLKGNTLNYEFAPQKKAFELKSITWETVEE